MGTDRHMCKLTWAARRMVTVDGAEEAASKLGPLSTGPQKALSSLARVPKACWANPSTFASMRLQQ